MRLEITFLGAVGWSRTQVLVVLSRRNLLTLLAKLDGYPKGSAKTIMKAEVIGDFVVQAEEDDVHYAHREPGGEMHPETEEAIRAAQQKIAGR